MPEKNAPRLIEELPLLYIFDEATSALDFHTEQEVYKRLKRVSSHATKLVIAHRLSTIVDADQIIVLNNGKLIERGSHSALLSQEGLYAKLWHKQTIEKRNMSEKRLNQVHL